MSASKLTKIAEDELHERFQLQDECLKILDLVVMEWKSDPTSVQCFDLRIVERAKYVVKRLNELKELLPY